MLWALVVEYKINDIHVNIDYPYIHDVELPRTLTDIMNAARVIRAPIVSMELTRIEPEDGDVTDV